ncbi:MAG: hypothetical protein ABJA74_04260 [Lapillicoccus sp.]
MCTEMTADTASPWPGSVFIELAMPSGLLTLPLAPMEVTRIPV